MTVCPNGHQLAATDHYCRWCGAARPAADYEPAGKYARPASERAAQPVSGPLIGPYQPPQGYRPPATNALAVASLILGLVWFYWIGSVLAVIFGVVSLRQMKARDEEGKGLAVAGITLGMLGIAALLLFGVFTLSVVHQQQVFHAQFHPAQFGGADQVRVHRAGG